MPGQGEKNSASFYKNLALWVIFGLVLILIFNAFNETQQSQSKIIFSQFLTAVENGSINQVTIKGNELLGVYTDGTRFRTYAPDDAKLIDILTQKGVQIEVKPNEDSWLTDMFISMIPIILFIGVFLYLMQQMQGGGAKALSFGKSRAKQLTEGKQKATFEDVAGADEAKEELIEIIEFLKDPQKFQKLGGKIPKGVMLIGAPGTGKTLLARAVAGEADVPFFTISGSDFVEMFVGVGASRVRDLFEQGKKNAPCIIFVDEIDAVGRHRGAGLGGGHDEREQTLNQLLVELDGFESNEGVIIIAATNRPDVLDPALLRPGRFDRQVVVSVPDVRGREGILAVHMKHVTISKNVDRQLLARGTPGFSGADLANLVNEAALLAARKKKPSVEMEDLEEAKDKVMMGRERRSLIISDNEKRNTAYHEAGHALVAKMLPGADPIHKVTIIPRGMSMGSTHYLPVDERHSYSKEYLEINIAVLLGGRAAEEIILNSLSNGASNDIERASEIARKMVCEWGMSEVLGPLAFGKKEEQIFLGKEFGQQQNYSEETARLIDKEVKKIVIENFKRAKLIVTENRDKLELLAEELLEAEILDASQLDKILGIKENKKDNEEKEDIKSNTKEA